MKISSNSSGLFSIYSLILLSKLSLYCFITSSFCSLDKLRLTLFPLESKALTLSRSEERRVGKEC